MVIILTGASHTGKTWLAQRLTETCGIPYFSLDLLKMGMIRSGYTALTPEDDEALTALLWPVVREMIRTAIENGRHLVVEGGYVPFTWAAGFSDREREQIRCFFLVMSPAYIREHFGVIKAFAQAAEKRMDDSWCTEAFLLADNARYRAGCRAHGIPFLDMGGADFPPAAADGIIKDVQQYLGGKHV